MLIGSGILRAIYVKNVRQNTIPVDWVSADVMEIVRQGVHWQPGVQQPLTSRPDGTGNRNMHPDAAPTFCQSVVEFADENHGTPRRLSAPPP